MGGEVLVALLITGVLGDEVEVLSSDNDSSVHLGGNDGAGQDTATDGDETGERALLVCRRKVSRLLNRETAHCLPNLESSFPPLRIILWLIALHCSSPLVPTFRDRNFDVQFARTDVAALNGSLGGTETQTNILIPSSATLARSGALGLGLGVEEDVRLLLERTLRLDSQLGRPEN